MNDDRISSPSTVKTSGVTTGPLFATLAGALRQGQFEARVLGPGERIGPFEIFRIVAKGGMSSVYEASHRYLGRTAALKTLLSQATPEAAERFLREARALALIDHPCAVHIFDAGIQNAVPYIALELLDGTSLHALLKGGPLSPRRVTDLLLDVGSVLLRQEQLAIVHRDIKPSNVFERRTGRFCLIDYGIATTLGVSERPGASLNDDVLPDATQEFIGTPAYAAPEMISSRAVSHRTDLYGLGLVAWECLAGRRGRPRNGAPELVAAALNDELPRVDDVVADVPAWLATVVRNLTARDPDDRYPSAANLLDDIEAALQRARRPRPVPHGRAFVAMPFARRFAHTFAAVDTACEQVRLEARRMDERVFVEDIWGEVEREIERSAVVIADFSSQGWAAIPNPNVVTEAAHARARRKPLIVITQDPPERLPFDWRHVQVLRYTRSTAGLGRLVEDLVTRLGNIERLGYVERGAPPASAGRIAGAPPTIAAEAASDATRTIFLSRPAADPNRADTSAQ